MKRTVSTVIVSLLFGVVAQGQVFQFNSRSGVNSDTDGSLDGWTIADRLGGVDYSGYAGELSLIFANEDDLPTGLGVPRGTFLGDAEGAYADRLGLVVFCTDPNTGFLDSSSPAESFAYRPLALAAAESRYLSEGVAGYIAGGLKRAAYLIETFFDGAHAAGDREAAALQAAVWEVLTDSTPNLATGAGNYFLRNDTSQSILNLRSDEMIALTNSWFASAAADEWGGPDYDPGSRVVFWLDPTNVHLNQTVMSLNPDAATFSLVPEPSSGLLAMLGVFVGLTRRRR